jgi:hypothetical protein
MSIHYGKAQSGQGTVSFSKRDEDVVVGSDLHYSYSPWNIYIYHGGIGCFAIHLYTFLTQFSHSEKRRPTIICPA